jgi:hypothetical protein
MPAAGLLTSAQRQGLARLARRAWVMARERGGTAEDFDTWRHDQVQQVTGLAGLRELTQQHFRRVRGHFMHLAGNDAAALNDIVASETEGPRQTLFILARECNRAGLPLAYPAAISRSRFQTPNLDELTEKQLWMLIYTVRNRRKPAGRMVA